MEEEKKEVAKEDVCPKCHNTGIVKDADGSCHTCWDCMQNGRLNQHSEKLPDNSGRYRL